MIAMSIWLTAIINEQNFEFTKMVKFCLTFFVLNLG